MTTLDFQGRIALVTGGGKGVGRVVASKLAQRGAHVIVNYFHSQDEAQRTESEIRSRGGSVEILRGSVAKPDAVDAMFDEIARRHDGLDVLVNNAAYSAMRPFRELTERDWDRVVGTGLHGVRWCTLAAAPLLAQRRGCIVNMSSVGATMAVPNYVAAGVTKAAVEALTRYLAVEFAPDGIRVNTASASSVDGAVVSAWPHSDVLRPLMEQAAPLGHVLVSPDEYAEAVLFLASAASTGITGQVLIVDRGTTTGYAAAASYWKYARTEGRNDPMPERL